MLKTPNNTPKHRFYILVSIVFFLNLILMWRFFQLQVLNFDFYEERAKSNYIRATSIPSSRGLILDRNKKIIVDNYPTYILYSIGAEVKDKNKNFEIINEVTGISIEQLNKNHKNFYRNKFIPTRLAKDLNITQLSRLEERKNELSGIIYKQYPERIYNSNIRASHILGYLKQVDKNIITNEDDHNYEFDDLVGWSGIEKKYEKTLRGSKGVSYFQVDAFGRESGRIDGANDILPVPGTDILTTIDLDLQKFIERKLDGLKGVVIVSNPESGEILAMISSPDYDPSLFRGFVSNKDWKSLIENTDRPLLNRAINGTYPPGSIFKMVVAIELLERNLIDENWQVLCNGEYEFFESTHRCTGSHGYVNLNDAMTMSCNIFFYEAVQKIRLDNLAKRSKDLFHGLPTGIDLPNEMKGRVPDRAYMNKLYGTDGWSTGALLNISIGQGEVLVTPIQMIAYVNTIATSGNYNPIYIVKNEGGSAISTPISQSTWKKINDYMKNVIVDQNGTGRLSDPKISNLSIYGKTGTAENPHGEPHAWFIGYSDNLNRKNSVVVLIENGGSGGKIASPFARDIFRFLNNKNKEKS